MDLAQDPELEIAPSRIGLTDLGSFFWLAEQLRPVQATATAGGLSVTAEAHPVQYIWDFGDETDKLTEGPGLPWTRWQNGNISHMYETRARYDVSVEVVWSARWRIGAGRGCRWDSSLAQSILKLPRTRVGIRYVSTIRRCS
jgi:PKD domain